MSQQKKLWHIYHAENTIHTKPPKDKFVVIAYKDTRYYGFFINSMISNWIKNRPDHLKSVVEILSSEHSCLSYDSHVDCSQIYSFSDSDLSDKKDAVSKGAKQVILEAVRDCLTLERKHIKAILLAENMWSDES